MELKFKRPLKTMLIAVAVIAAVVCIGECILMKKVPEVGAHYGLYIVFLLLAVLLGGVVVYFFTWLITSRETREARLQKVRTSALAPIIENLENVASRRE